MVCSCLEIFGISFSDDMLCVDFRNMRKEFFLFGDGNTHA